MRNIALAAAAIFLFGTGAMVLIAVIPGATVTLAPSPPVESADQAPAPPSIPSAGRRLDLEAIRRDLGRPELPPPPVIHDVPPPRPPPGSWEAIRPAARPAELGPVGAAIGRELNELHPSLSACFDEVTQARYGQQGYSSVGDYARTDDHGTTVLMLEVETLQGQVRIVDAPVETRGGASDGLLACAQRVLRGHVVQVPEAKPGSRHRMLFTLLP